MVCLGLELATSNCRWVRPFVHIGACLNEALPTNLLGARIGPKLADSTITKCDVGVVHKSLFIRLMNSLLFHWSLFIATSEFIQNLVKSLCVQGHLFIVMLFDIKDHNLVKNHTLSKIISIDMMINSWHLRYYLQAKVTTTLVSTLANSTLIILFSELLKISKKKNSSKSKKYWER